MTPNTINIIINDVSLFDCDIDVVNLLINLSVLLAYPITKIIRVAGQKRKSVFEQR
ncbi:hypothetical protein GCM10023078_40260 [Gibbsiella greigii]